VISVVIPTWNGLQLLNKCLQSLREQSFKEFEIIVVDNGSTDGTVDWLKKNAPDVETVALERNFGFSGAVNAGIRTSEREFVVLLNNDTVVTPDWLKAFVDASEKYQNTSIFTSKVIVNSPPYLIDTAGDGFTIAGFGYKIGWMSPETSFYSRSRHVFGASGCSSMYRRKIFDEIGYFDEDFFAFAEDLDFSFRALIAGHKIIYVPDSRVFHSVRATARKKTALFLYHRNLIWLIYKNFPWQLLLLYFPHMFSHTLFIAVKSVLQGWFPIYFKSLKQGLLNLNKMKQKRRDIQESRILTIDELRHLLTGNWLGVHWELSRIGRYFRGQKSDR